MSTDIGPVFLTVRGTAQTETLADALKLHNATAGNPQGVAAARSLGDLSHNVFIPVAGPMSSAKQGELLFHDVWQNPEGLMQFFSNPDVQKGGAALFKQRDATVWMPATGAYGFSLPAPARRTERYVGMVRGVIASPEETIAAFRSLHEKTQREARQRGQLSHALYIKLNPPGDHGPVEALGVDVWFDGQGMAEHYGKLDMAQLKSVFSGVPDATTWQQAPGEWVEW